MPPRVVAGGRVRRFNDPSHAAQIADGRKQAIDAVCVGQGQKRAESPLVHLLRLHVEIAEERAGGLRHRVPCRAVLGPQHPRCGKPSDCRILVAGKRVVERGRRNPADVQPLNARIVLLEDRHSPERDIARGKLRRGSGGIELDRHVLRRLIDTFP